jgi:hypothetical protein
MTKDEKAKSTTDATAQPEAPDITTESEERPFGKAQKMVSNAADTTGNIGSGIVGTLAHVATDLVHGVGDLGGEVVTVVRDTANTAIAGVGSVGGTAVHTVTDLLAELVSGVRGIGSAAMRNRTASPHEARQQETEAEHRHMEKGQARETPREEAAIH